MRQGLTVKPRIALFLPNLEGGGAERAFVELANAFVDRGVNVDMVLASRTGPYLRELSESVRVQHLGTTRWWSVIGRLTRYLRAERPHALLSGLDVANMAAVAASSAAGMLPRCVVSQRAVLISVWQMDFPRTWRLWLQMMRWTYRRARLVICNSRAAADEVVGALGVDPARCAVIYNPIDVEAIERRAREPLTDPWLDDSAPPLILSVGSLTPRKDMATLIRAFAIVRQSRACNLLILGEGDERGALEQLVEDLGLGGSVRMPGFDPNPFAWMARARVLVSASRAEGCPNIIQQALVCGTRMVATDCPGGTAELLEEGRWGRLVPVRNADAMAAAIGFALDDPAPPDGRMYARRFGRDAAVDKYLGLLLGDFASASGPSHSTTKSVLT